MALFPRSILAATDLGEASDAVVRSAALLGRQAGAQVHLLHSLDLRKAPPAEAANRTGVDDQTEEARHNLRAQVERAFPDGVEPATAEVLPHAAHQAILDRAKEVSADLLLVGPHRGGDVGAHFLGTTADRVIRTAEVPCMVVPNALPERIDAIGVPTDFADPSGGALEVALGWGGRLREARGAASGAGPTIHVLYVGWPIELSDYPDMEQKTVRPAIDAQVERARTRVPGAEALDVDLEVLWENQLEDAIVRWTETRPDLVVMATHGRGALSRVLVGSVASRVARKSPRPVLLVPPSWWEGTGRREE